MTVPAIFENGVFRPLLPVNIQEGSRVNVEISSETEPALGGKTDEEAHRERVYEILSRRYNGGASDVAARHNEHQP